LLQGKDETSYWEYVDKQREKRHQKAQTSTPQFYEQKPSKRKTQFARSAPERTHKVFNNEPEPSTFFLLV
jgi:hypothetical protein